MLFMFVENSKILDRWKIKETFPTVRIYSILSEKKNDNYNN